MPLNKEALITSQPTSRKIFRCYADVAHGASSDQYAVQDRTHHELVIVT